MSLYTNLHDPRTTPTGRIQIGHKSGLLIIYLSISSVNIKPPRHSLGLTALVIVRACGTSSSGLVPRLLSIVSGNQANPNESVLAEAVMSHMHRTVYLQIMTWLWENGTYVLCNIFFVDD